MTRAPGSTCNCSWLSNQPFVAHFHTHPARSLAQFVLFVLAQYGAVIAYFVLKNKAKKRAEEAARPPPQRPDFRKGTKRQPISIKQAHAPPRLPPTALADLEASSA